MFLRKHPIDLLVLIFCCLFAGFLMFHTFQYRHGSFFIASKLWSDFAAHIPLIRSFSLGKNLPVQYPTFAGEPIRYHFLFYLLVAGLEKIGLNLAFSLNLLSAVGYASLLYLIYAYSKLIFHRRLVGILAVGLFLFNGSLSFLNFLKNLPPQSNLILSLIHNSRFPSFGPWDGGLIAAFWNLNIYTNQRHLGLSFALSLLILYPLFVALYQKRFPKKWVTVSICLILFFLTWLHQAAAVIVLTLSGLIILLNIRRLRPYLLTFVCEVIVLIPGLVYYATLGSSHLAFQPGFLSPDIHALFFLKYWFLNLGLYLLILPVLFIWLDKKGKSVIFAALSLFVLANLVRLSPDMINNHKLVNFFMVIVVIYTAGFLIHLWSRHLIMKLLLPILILSLTLSGIIDFFPVINDHYLSLPDIPKNPTALWIVQNTPKNSVFLTTTYLYNPASLAGRKTFLDYGYFNWSMGYDEHDRRDSLSQIFSPLIPSNQLCRLLQKYHLDYILIAPGEGDLGFIHPQNSNLVRSFPPTFTSTDGFTIYSVAHNCPL